MKIFGWVVLFFVVWFGLWLIGGLFGIVSLPFHAASNAYVEWKGDYMVSDQPLKLSTQPELIRDITNQ